MSIKNKLPNSLRKNPVEVYITGPYTSKGYVVGTDSKNRKYYLLNALKGETILAKAIEKKKGKILAKTLEILNQSDKRIPQQTNHHMSSTPWEVIERNEEINIKKEFLVDTFSNLLDKETLNKIEIKYSNQDMYYRNKIEFSFFGKRDDSLCFSFFMRGNNRFKIPFEETPLIPETASKVGKEILNFLNSFEIKAKDLKFLTLRHSKYEDKCIAGLYVSNKEILPSLESFENFVSNNESIKGIKLSYTDPRTPASQTHENLGEIGSLELEEKILDKKFLYDFDQFFQINIDLFSETIKDIREYLSENKIYSDNLVDLYSGVGSIGILLSDFSKKVIGVETSKGSLKMAYKNAKLNSVENFEFREEKVENILSYISKADTLILDPPREGIGKTTDKILQDLPETIIYLSCNYKTQAQDLEKILPYYKVDFIKGYDYFPNTPHIENLIILKKIN